MKRVRRGHIFSPEPHAHYVDPRWCSERLFEVERFAHRIHDPCAGWGHIPEAARAAGYCATGSDLVDRDVSNKPWWRGECDFFKSKFPRDTHLVGNPPYHLLRKFTERAVAVATKVALIFPVRRLPAALWLADLPLRRILLMNPRPSMPSGSHILSGGKIGGGTQDFAWLIFERGYAGKPEIHWLERDRAKNEMQSVARRPRIITINFKGWARRCAARCDKRRFGQA